MDIIWKAEDIKKATNGKINDDWSAGKIVIDSRSVSEGDLFLALRGNTDGHLYVNNALKSNASAVIIDHIPANMLENTNYCLVEDTKKALNQLAIYRRDQLTAKKIAVTGSVGKTSTKEMLNIAFSAIGKTYASRGNFNNDLGVPISLASTPIVDYAIYEIGMNHAGEITPLTKLVRPDIAIITNVEAAHLEFFNSIEGIAKAKAEIFLGLKGDGCVILNSDNEWFDFLRDKARNLKIKNIYSFGKNADAKILSYKESDNTSCIKIDIMGEEIEYILNFQAYHIAIASVISLLTVKLLGGDIRLAADNLINFKLPKSRGEILQLNFKGKNITLIDDSYNASPAAMKAALNNLSNKKAKRKIAILADMLEMGENSKYFHQELINHIGNIDKIITIGENMSYFYDKLSAKLKYKHYNQTKDIIEDIDKYIEHDDMILIKGSFGTEIYKLAEYIKTK